jgi:hypothetical protein
VASEFQFEIGLNNFLIVSICALVFDKIVDVITSEFKILLLEKTLMNEFFNHTIKNKAVKGQNRIPVDLTQYASWLKSSSLI